MNIKVPSHNEDGNREEEKGNGDVNIEVGGVRIQICQGCVTKVEICALLLTLHKKGLICDFLQGLILIILQYKGSSIPGS